MFSTPATRLGRHRVAPQGINGQVQVFSNNVFAAANGLTYSSSGNNVTVTGQHTTDIPLTVSGTISATGNLFQVVAPLEGIVFAINSTGVVVGNGAGLTNISGSGFAEANSVIHYLYNGI